MSRITELQTELHPDPFLTKTLADSGSIRRAGLRSRVTVSRGCPESVCFPEIFKSSLQVVRPKHMIAPPGNLQCQCTSKN